MKFPKLPARSKGRRERGSTGLDRHEQADDAGRSSRVTPIESICGPPMLPESLFLTNLALIERLIEYTCRRAHCPAQEAEEFAGWAKLRFVSDDYGILRKFEGKS